MTLRREFLALALLLGGCQFKVDPLAALGEGGIGDDAAVGAIDLVGADLVGADLSTIDLKGVDQVVPDLMPPPDLVPPADLMPPGKAPGLTCTSDGECSAQLCRAVVLGGPLVCVSPCTSNAECTPFPNLFCEPTTAGASTGYCIPRSPNHCASCTVDGDCGILAETCLQVTADLAPACHIDCAIANGAACPADYACQTVGVRRLCVPTGGVCVNALGGFCDLVSAPQACTRVGPPGTCTGVRTCDNGTKRFSACGAPTPTYKTCTTSNPPNCTVVVDPALLTTAQYCGSCGFSCPGFGQSTGDPACTDPSLQQCSFTCRGENYDVDNSAANGCELFDSAVSNHTMTDATARPDHDCFDINVDNFTGFLYSDSRVHTNPTVVGFNTTNGDAPDYWKVKATGGGCANNYAFMFTTTGGGNTPCYRCTLFTDVLTAGVGVTISGNGTGSVSDGSLTRYTTGSTVTFVIDKTCSLPTQEAVSYSVTYHL